MQSEFEGIDTSEPNCVVIGDATTHFTYDAMNEAFRILMKSKENQLISMGSNKFYQENGQLTLDLGAYKAALEYACDKKAKVIGKPSNEYFNTALKSLNMKAEVVVMIGDDINGDIAGAQAVGIRGVLVRTGKFRKERDENHSTVKPDAIVDNLYAFINCLNN